VGTNMVVSLCSVLRVVEHVREQGTLLLCRPVVLMRLLMMRLLLMKVLLPLRRPAEGVLLQQLLQLLLLLLQRLGQMGRRLVRRVAVAFRGALAVERGAGGVLHHCRCGWPGARCGRRCKVEVPSFASSSSGKASSSSTAEASEPRRAGFGLPEVGEALEEEGLLWALNLNVWNRNAGLLLEGSSLLWDCPKRAGALVLSM